MEQLRDMDSALSEPPVALLSEFRGLWLVFRDEEGEEEDEGFIQFA